MEVTWNYAYSPFQINLLCEMGLHWNLNDQKCGRYRRFPDSKSVSPLLLKNKNCAQVPFVENPQMKINSFKKPKKGTVVNRALSFLHGGQLEVILTVHFRHSFLYLICLIFKNCLIRWGVRSPQACRPTRDTGIPVIHCSNSRYKSIYEHVH